MDFPDKIFDKAIATFVFSKKLDGPIHYLSGVPIARKTVENVEQTGWKIEEVQGLTSNGIFRMMEAKKPH